MVGWIGFSCLPVVGGIADIRDAVQAILNGDPVGAAMNAAGAIPGPGDGVKITGAIVCYTGDPEITRFNPKRSPWWNAAEWPSSRIEAFKKIAARYTRYRDLSRIGPPGMHRGPEFRDRFAG